ncbi:hypothetical protein A3Q34_10950 [Colwellia sp. PAMC 20917]|nr:hypothetical protein A3Q34_10950 [Colwellia sp. PAMC 20917]
MLKLLYIEIKQLSQDESANYFLIILNKYKLNNKPKLIAPPPEVFTFAGAVTTTASALLTVMLLVVLTLRPVLSITVNSTL